MQAFELILSSTKDICGESHVILNGRQLALTWEGTNGAGNGTVLASLAGGSRAFDLFVNYRALCITSPEESVEQYAAQILTLTFHLPNTKDDGTSGFAVSFNSLGEPEIFRLITSPVAILEDEPSLSFWLNSGEQRQTQGSENVLGDTPDRVRLEEELQRLNFLKLEAEQFQERINKKEQEIRLHLLLDCISISARLKDCNDLKCFIVTSFKVVPDVFRLMKYKFGSLPSSLPEGWCQTVPSTTQTANTNNTEAFTNATSVSEGPKGFNQTNVPANGVWLDQIFPQVLRPPKLPNPSSRYPSTKLLIRDLVIVVLGTSVILILYKKCRNSLDCRRRRVDMAARREERRTRFAYQNAARRHRWRQWWNNRVRTFTQINNNESEHSLPTYEGDRRTSTTQDQNCSSSQANGDSVQAEILGLRRVFDLVGELIRPEEENRRDLPNDSAFPPSRISTATPAPSSTAQLTTIGSPRTSSVLSYETDSSVTLDTLLVDPDTESTRSS